MAGGAGSDSEEVEVDGTVVELTGAGTFLVDIGGQMITAYLSGKLRMNYVRVMAGDRVRVAYSPSNPRGRITYRYK